MHDGRVRGFFAVGAEGISKPMNLGNLVRSAHAFGASFVFLVRAEYSLRESISDTSKAELQLPVYDYPDVGRDAAAARLPAGGQSSWSTTRSPAELPPPAERRLRVRAGAGLAVAGDAGTLRPRRPHPDPLLHQPRRRGCGRDVRSDAVPLGRFAERPVRVGGTAAAAGTTGLSGSTRRDHGRACATARGRYGAASHGPYSDSVDDATDQAADAGGRACRGRLRRAPAQPRRRRRSVAPTVTGRSTRWTATRAGSATSRSEPTKQAGRLREAGQPGGAGGPPARRAPNRVGQRAARLQLQEGLRTVELAVGKQQIRAFHRRRAGLRRRLRRQVGDRRDEGRQHDGGASGTSSKGTNSLDTYSLAGFAPAYEAMRDACRKREDGRRQCWRQRLSGRRPGRA